MNSKANEYVDAIKREVEQWPGVAVDFVEGKKHPKAKFKFGDKVLSRPFASTPSDSAYGIHQMLGDMRRAMKQLGAERAKPEPTREEDEAPYRKPNEGRAKRPDPVEVEPAPVIPTVAEKLVDAGVKVIGVDQAKDGSETHTEFRRGPNGTMTVESVRRVSVAEAEKQRRAEEFKARVAAVEDGIYFGLDFDVYCAVEALGSTNLTQLNVSPGTFWKGSWLDPDNEPDVDEDATNAQILGRAYHCAILQPENLDRLYMRQPIHADYPKDMLLTSDADVRAALAGMSEPQTRKGETNEERGERLLEAGYEGAIWPLIKARYEREAGNRQLIRGDLWDDMMKNAARLRGIPEILRHVGPGFSEVSVIWTDANGIRCKCRFDKLLEDEWVDLKSFSNPKRKQVLQCLSDAVRFNYYYIQAVHYRDGWNAIVAQLVGVKGEATDEQRELIASIVERAPRPQCWLVFQETGGAPNIFARQFPFTAVDRYRAAEISEMVADPAKAAIVKDMMGQTTAICRRGVAEVARAKGIFQHYNAVFPRGEPWIPLNVEDTFHDDDFNRFWLENGR